MNVQWDPKIGPATIVSVGGAVAVLMAVAATWGSLQTKLDHMIIANDQTDVKINKAAKESRSQDEKIAQQSAQISGLQATVNFIVPSLQRIETRLEAVLQNGQPPKINR